MKLIRVSFTMVALVVTLTVTSVAQSTGQDPSPSAPPSPNRLSLEVRPGVDIPIGSTSQVFALGGALDLNVRYRLGDTPCLLLGGLTYSFAPDQSSDSISIATVSAWVGAQLPLTRLLNLNSFATVGYYYGTLNDFSVSATDPYLGGGLEVQMLLNSSWGIGVAALYRSYFGLYQGISAAVSTTYLFGGGKSGNTASAPDASARDSQPGLLGASSNAGPATAPIGALQITNTDLPPIFPIFYSYYDDHPIGRVELKNESAQAVSNLSATVYIKQYMDNPKTVSVEGTIEPKATTTVDLYALFTDSVLSITEGTKVSAEVTLSYMQGGRAFKNSSIETIRFLNRNAMTWDDNRRAASFVTAKDPAVLAFAKSITGYIRSKEVRSINPSLQTAMAFHEALDLYGLNYVQDPTTPYVELSKKSDTVDFLQFPRQSLQYKAGDCDDLSILYSSLLEAVGEHAAFVTVPGHIFVAVDTGLDPKQAAAALMSADQFIVYENTVWIPVEVTLRHQGFLKAWEQGARQWYQANPLGQAGFYPVEIAWEAYAPVGLPGAAPDITVPPSDIVLATYLDEVTKFIDRALFPQVAKLQAEIRASGSLPAMNKLGILYAKYGQPDKAGIEFAQVLQREPNNLPALLNLGNLAYLKQDWLGARDYYQKASDLTPNNAHVLLALARVNQELENFGNVKRTYALLQQVDPVLAQQYSYLAMGPAGGNARAADVEMQRKEVVWAGE